MNVVLRWHAFNFGSKVSFSTVFLRRKTSDTNLKESIGLYFLENNKANSLSNQGIEANWLEWTKFCWVDVDFTSVAYMVKLAHVVIDVLRSPNE